MFLHLRSSRRGVLSQQEKNVPKPQHRFFISHHEEIHFNEANKGDDSICSMSWHNKYPRNKAGRQKNNRVPKKEAMIEEKSMLNHKLDERLRLNYEEDFTKA